MKLRCADQALTKREYSRKHARRQCTGVRREQRRPFILERMVLQDLDSWLHSSIWDKERKKKKYMGALDATSQADQAEA